MTDPPFDGVLVYDGDCPFCSAAATALRRIDSVGAVAYSHAEVRAFLAAQFDDEPFALVFADYAGSTVYVGRDAAGELCERAGLPVLVQDVVGENYESLADAIRTVTGVDREPDPYHGTYPMADDARNAYADVAAIAKSTTEHLPRS